MDVLDDSDLDRKPPPAPASSFEEAGGLASDAPPLLPSLLARREDEEEDDDDDDADNWSRQVETDESAPAAASLLLHLDEDGNDVDDEDGLMAESVAEEGSGLTARLVRGSADDDTTNLLDDEQAGRTSGGGILPPPPPSHPELTLKERLVMRERQRRIETERARLKRQFLAANANGVEEEHGGGGGGDDDDDGILGGGGADHDEQSSSAAVVRGPASAAARLLLGEEGAMLGSAGGSVTEEGTLGEESTRAHADHDDSRDQLGFNMERFLRGSESFNPRLETMAEEDRPIVMERFLNEPVVVNDDDVGPGLASEGMATSVIVDEEGATVGRSFEDDGESERGAAPDDETNHVPAESFVSYGDETNVSTNASVHVEADDDDVARDPLTPLASMDVPDATASDATPADDEPRVLRLTEADMQEMAAIEQASIGNAPPSEREDEELSEIGELADFAGSGLHHGRSRQGTPTTAVESASLHSAGNHSIPHASSTEEKPGSDAFGGDAEGTHPVSLPGLPGDVVVNHLYSDPPLLADESMARMSPTVAQGGLEEDDQVSPLLVNRVLRPGMIKMKPHHHRLAPRGDDEPMPEPVVVEGFDFDKNAPSSPPVSTHRHDDSFSDLPPDVWSPAGKMQVSPISAFKPSALDATMEGGPTLPFAVADAQNNPRAFRDPVSPFRESNEGTPLLRGDIPPEVITSNSPSQEFRESNRSIRNTRRFSMVSIGSIFSDVRSEEDVSREEIQNESEVYLASSILSRAFPERMFALTVTLIFEIPVLLMISGGSDALCQLVGRRRYQLLMGFIPLTSAISGNVGLQASTLTTRAISHTHVTPTNYLPWFLNEIGAACVLGMGMGLLLGGIAFVASGMDFAFGFTILFAQFISIVTAGCTGTFAPLLFSFIFRRDSGKWGGPLETAIQDIVGSFAMVIISYQILKFLGPGPVSPDDVCSAAPTDDLA